MNNTRSLLEELYQSAPNSVKSRDPGTPDPTKYHDFGSATYSDGKPMGGSVPGTVQTRFGRASIRSVIIPSHNPDGLGSMGYDPHKPQQAFIDPELTGGKIMVDFANLSKMQINDAVQEANDMKFADASDPGVAAYLLLSEASTHQPEKTAAARLNEAVAVERRATSFGTVSPPQLPQLPDRIAAPVDISISQGATLKAAPTVFRPPAPSFRPGSLLADIQSPPTVPQRTEEPMLQSTPKKLRKIIFELPKPAGKMTAYYHDVIRTENLLILVYDHSSGGSQHVWFPSAPDDDEEPTKIAVLVHDEEDQPDTGFVVYPTDARFVYQNHEFFLMTIAVEKSYKAQANEQPT